MAWPTLPALPPPREPPIRPVSPAPPACLLPSQKHGFAWWSWEHLVAFDELGGGEAMISCWSSSLAFRHVEILESPTLKVHTELPQVSGTAPVMVVSTWLLFQGDPARRLHKSGHHEFWQDFLSLRRKMHMLFQNRKVVRKNMNSDL